MESTRIIDGNKYRLVGCRKNKKDADNAADRLRKQGWSCRVLGHSSASKTEYCVYKSK